MMDSSLVSNVSRSHKIIKWLELLGVLLAIAASLYLSQGQESTDMQLLFAVFLASSMILAATTFIQKNYNFLLMSSVYLLINMNGFIGSF